MSDTVRIAILEVLNKGLEARVRRLEDENEELIQALLVEIMERPPVFHLHTYPPQWPEYPPQLPDIPPAPPYWPRPLSTY